MTAGRASMIVALAALAAAPAAQAGALSLDQALEKASYHNEDVAILEEHVEQARAVRLQVLSGLLPWISASASMGLSDEVSMPDGEGGKRVIVPGTDWGWGFTASLTLVDLGLIPAASAASKGVGAVEALLGFGRDEILYATAQAYVTSLFARAAVGVREREVETRVKYRAEVEALMQADEALALDLSRAELAVLEASQALAQARVEAVLAMDALSLLMGEKPGTEYDLAPLDASLAPQAAPGPEEVSEQIDLALDDREDLEASALSLKAASATKTSSWLGLLPTATFSASYDQGPKSFRSPEGYTWLVSFNLVWTLFDGGYTAGKIKESTSKASEALLEKAKSEKAVEGEVRSAWLLFTLAIENRETATKQAEVARKAWEMAEERHKAGLSKGLEVDEALDALAEAEMGLLGQEMNLELAWLDYLRASGQFDQVFEVK